MITMDPSDPVEHLHAENKKLRAEIKKIKRITLFEAATEVASHWNDKTTMVNQYDQAQRSAAILQSQGYTIEILEE